MNFAKTTLKLRKILFGEKIMGNVKMIKKYPGLIFQIDNQSERLISCALKSNANIFKYFPKEWKNSVGFCAIATRLDKSNYSFVSQNIKEKDDFNLLSQSNTIIHSFDNSRNISAKFFENNGVLYKKCNDDECEIVPFKIENEEIFAMRKIKYENENMFYDEQKEDFYEMNAVDKIIYISAIIISGMLLPITFMCGFIVGIAHILVIIFG